MVKITNGDLVLKVSSGAFKSIYAPAGWVEVGETPAMVPEEPAVGSQETGGSNHTADPEGAPDGSPEGSSVPSPKGETEGHHEEDLTDEETLANMTDVELKQYASLLGIKTKTLNTREELMEAIKAHQE